MEIVVPGDHCLCNRPHKNLKIGIGRSSQVECEPGRVTDGEFSMTENRMHSCLSATGPGFDRYIVLAHLPLGKRLNAIENDYAVERVFFEVPGSGYERYIASERGVLQ
jgi:hypothetical protein